MTGKLDRTSKSITVEERPGPMSASRKTQHMFGRNEQLEQVMQAVRDKKHVAIVEAQATARLRWLCRRICCGCGRCKRSSLQLLLQIVAVELLAANVLPSVKRRLNYSLHAQLHLHCHAGAPCIACTWVQVHLRSNWRFG